MNLPIARALFHAFLAEPHVGGWRHGLHALGLVGELKWGGYSIRRPETGDPWCLVHSGRIVAVEPGGFPLAVLATGERSRVVVEPLPVLYRPGDANIHAYMADGSVWEVMPSGKPYMVRAPRAYRVALERMRAVGEAPDAA